jgi:metal-sulfur cluster biosynthetic enzyme
LEEGEMKTLIVLTLLLCASVAMGEELLNITIPTETIECYKNGIINIQVITKTEGAKTCYRSSKDVRTCWSPTYTVKGIGHRTIKSLLDEGVLVYEVKEGAEVCDE